ncbi:uncharacterized protein METZ01_LOCUS312190, partial [marine metagenome]
VVSLLALIPTSGITKSNTGRRGCEMPKIKHIAIATQDIDKTAGFYKDVFGLREIAKLESANANGYFLSDGNVNMAILDFQ